MRRSVPVLPLLALAALGFVAGACKQPDSILFVTVYGPRSLMATHFEVQVTAGSPPDPRTITVTPTPQGEIIALPASFTIALDASHGGPVMIHIDALDALENTLGFGDTSMEHIRIGGQTDLAVQLMEELPPDMPDGGAGGTGGQGGQGGSPGKDGGAGDGGAGQGGAGGTDAGSDAMGFDAATD